MGFIKDTLQQDDDKYISFKNIILYVQSLDKDKPSLSDTAMFLLKKYETSHADEIENEIFQREYTGKYEKKLWDIPNHISKKFFYNFLHFVIGRNNFEYKQDDRIRSWATDGCLEVPLGYSRSVYDKYMESYVSIAVANSFLTNNCGLNMEHDLPKFIRQQEENNTLDTDDYYMSEEQRILKEVREIFENAHNLALKTRDEIDSFQNEKAHYKRELEKMYAVAERLQNELVEYELIKRHRERSAEFNALIETLKYYAVEYDSGTQPLKKSVALTFNEKAGLKEDNRRGEEAARILGLPEKKS